MTQEDLTRTRIEQLFDSQRLAVLATQHDGQPYTSLIGFWASPDLKQLFFATSRITRKYAYLSTDRRVSLLINNSCNQSSDFYEAVSVTVIGEATEADRTMRAEIIPHYLAKHPQLSDFIRSDSTALIHVKVNKYLVVHNFQNVWELEMS
jgi:nitroimidazol reductase NimA-like FMN-containing flavoprotein (pyridoxamine 5'-phosphate oxidase superfamily)